VNILHDIDKSRITAEKFTAVIEIPRGCRIKYEIDKQTGLLLVDRVLKTSMAYPLNYGFIPRTICEDGDALDVLVIMNEAVVPMTLVECKPVGIIYMIDNGERDEKIIAVPVKSTLDAAPKEIVDEIVHFMKNYKSLQSDNKVEIPNVGDRAAAQKFIGKSIEMYLKGGKK